MELYFATTNKGKVDSVKRTLADVGIEVKHIELEMPEPQSHKLEKIAVEKVMFAYSKIKKPVIAMDSGFYLDAWPGFPGPYIKPVLETLGTSGILKLVEEEKRSCYFETAMAFMSKDLEEPKIFSSRANGEITRELRGKPAEHHWSELYYVFIPEGEHRTLAEMSEEEYHEWRRRTRADYYLREFAQWLKEGKG
ncbi:MAG: hypothetical protein D6769_02035 [Methanobacteriota archaeon]|nr:MAG: hypothetical protein D6769_02035 [Euryarchaeota archaeon]